MRSAGPRGPLDAAPVTGECLAPGLRRRDAARVTSERSGVVTRAALP